MMWDIPHQVTDVTAATGEKFKWNPSLDLTKLKMASNSYINYLEK